MAHLKLSNIIDGRIKYVRQKTDEPYDIKIPDQLGTVLKFFINGKSKADYVLPIIKSDEPIGQYKEVLWARKRYNRNLKILAELAGIEENLTSYVSRHSFATNAVRNGATMEFIQESLGHENLSTTQNYFAGFDDDTKKEFAATIMNFD